MAPPETISAPSAAFAASSTKAEVIRSLLLIAAVTPATVVDPNSFTVVVASSTIPKFPLLVSRR